LPASPAPAPSTPAPPTPPAAEPIASQTTAGSVAPAAPPDPFALDTLATELYDRLRSMLVDELYVGRERSQLLTDLP
jgi:hypothetical protein